MVTGGDGDEVAMMNDKVLVSARLEDQPAEKKQTNIQSYILFNQILDDRPPPGPWGEFPKYERHEGRHVTRRDHVTRGGAGTRSTARTDDDDHRR